MALALASALGTALALGVTVRGEAIYFGCLRSFSFSGSVFNRAATTKTESKAQEEGVREVAN